MSQLAGTSSNGDGSSTQRSTATTPNTGAPPPFTRRPSMDGGAETHIYPLKSVAHPATRSASSTNGDAASSRPLSPVESVGSSLPPRSLDPYLSEPTNHHKAEWAAAADDGTNSSNGSLASNARHFLSTRLEHQEEDGEHYIITGRDGEIVRCEDEPIHAPGAVQAYGVLIAFDRVGDDTLVVQQVSENSRHIIGISPSALFRASSLADVLPPEEVDTLLDALDALDERDSYPDNLDPGPLYFELSGFGSPGTDMSDPHSKARLEWTCHAALHRPSPTERPALHVLELELMNDDVNPLKTASDDPLDDERGGMACEEEMEISDEALRLSTRSTIKSLRALNRLRNRRGRAVGSSKHPAETDFVGLLSQVNDQLSRATDLKSFAKMTASVFAEISEASRCMIYQFDEQWNGHVLAEQVDWTRTRDLYLGLSFPASDIPAQARKLYEINKTRILYDRDAPTARLCCRTAEEVDSPLDMTHSLLRAMSPIHIKYLANMGVRSSMSISITAFGSLWGLCTLHTYGKFGHRVSFPIRQLCKILGESVSRHIERISYATRLNARKLITTEPTDANPSGFIVAKSEDLLSLFDADAGVLSIGDEAKILGSIPNSQDVLALLEFLRIQQFTETVSTQDISKDWPDLVFPSQGSTIAGALCIPLTDAGKDFIVLLRQPQDQEVRWAGNPHAKGNSLEPRKSFKTFTEKVSGRSRAWTDEQLESSAVLLLVYSKFIAVWREKQSALAANQLNSILLANASHEVRTPLNAIVNYLELALDGDITDEAREHVTRSHEASRSLVHVINDLLDLTRTEHGQDLYLQDPFNLPKTLEDALTSHRREAERRGVSLDIVESPTGTPSVLLGDRAKIRITIIKLVENALKHTNHGGILVEWGETSVGVDMGEHAVAKAEDIRIAISVTDTGCGIPDKKIEAIFREFEAIQQDGVEANAVVGLGLATVARIVRTLGGQLRVESKTKADAAEGSTGTKVTLVLPFRLAPPETNGGGDVTPASRTSNARPSVERQISSLGRRTSTNSGSAGSEIDSLIADMSSSLQGSAMSPDSASSSRPTRQSAIRSNTSRSMPSRDSAGSRSDGGSQQSGPSGTSSAGAHRQGSISRRQRSGSLRLTESGNPTRGPQLDRVSGDDRARSKKTNPPQDTSASAPINDDVLVRDFETDSLQSKHETESVQSGRADSVRSKRETASVQSKHGTASSRSTAGTAGSASVYSGWDGSVSSAQLSAISRPMKVLVVEDEPINATLIERRLIKSGHKIKVVSHGLDAVRAMEDDPTFELILMDLNMPIMDGYEASATIRKSEANYVFPSGVHRPASHELNGGVPIIAVTANSQERGRAQLVAAGIDGWCLKPVRFARLAEIMAGAVESAVRDKNLYRPGEWEKGGWLYQKHEPPSSRPASPLEPRSPTSPKPR